MEEYPTQIQCNHNEITNHLNRGNQITTVCKDKSSIIESNKKEYLSDLFTKGVFQSILGRLKPPQIKIRHFEGSKDKEY